LRGYDRGRLPFNFAALLDGHIRISPGGETKKIKVLDSDPKTSLAKSPNARLVALYTIWQADFSSGQEAAWRL